MASPLCTCGCGGTTKGGSFLPGHDARYKSQLIKEALAGNTEAEGILAQRGWTKFLDKSRDVSTKPKAVRVVEANASKLRPMEELAIMKAACKVLKWTDQYRQGTLRSIRIGHSNALQIATLQYPPLELREDGSAHEPFSTEEQAAIDKALAMSHVPVID